MAGQVTYESPLPRVEGRHRNHALAHARSITAAQLIISGWTYQSVADHLGYQNRGTVHRLVQPVLRRSRPAGLDDAFQLHYERLEGLLPAHYDRAAAGDPGATRVVLQVLHEIARLLRLYGAEAREAQDEPYEVIDPADLVRRGHQAEMS